MNNKIISLETKDTLEFSKKVHLRSKTSRWARALGWSVSIGVAGVIGFMLGGVFGMACGLFGGFLFAQVLDPLLTKKFS